MSALREMLAAQDEAALAAVASVGLVRRAKAGLATMAVMVLEESAHSAVCQVDAQQVTLDKDGPAKARCDCPATGICRHVLTAVLHLRAGAPEAPPMNARDEIAALSPAEIEAFAGRDWPQALRIAALSPEAEAETEETGASCVLTLTDAPGPVTFVAGGGLRKALFKGPEGRRKRFVAAAALVLGRHNLAVVTEGQAAVDPELLQHGTETVLGALSHGLRGDPSLAQDRLFDTAISARADAAPRLSAILRATAHHAGRLANRDPEADPCRYLEQLAECYALIRALRSAPSDPVLAGQLRRDYQEAPACTLAVLGVGLWIAPSGGRGLTIHGWDGRRFLSSGPARAAGIDPTFAPRGAYRQPWWPGTSPQQITGQTLHLPAPRVSADDVLPRDTGVQSVPDPFPMSTLPFHLNWRCMGADVADRQGLGLRAGSRPVPVLIDMASVLPPRFDRIDQCDLLDVVDATGTSVALRLPDADCGRILHARQHRLRGALIEAMPGEGALSLRLITVYFDTPLATWNVTLEPVPKALREEGLLGTLRSKGAGFFRPAPGKPTRNTVAAFADRALQTLCDMYSGPPNTTKTTALSHQAEALGLTEIAPDLAEITWADPNAVLQLSWQLLLIRRASLRVSGGN